jgi:hypothetical protein
MGLKEKFWHPSMPRKKNFLGFGPPEEVKGDG